MSVVREDYTSPTAIEALIKTYSDLDGYGVKSDQTGAVYEFAIDPKRLADERTYTEVKLDTASTEE